MKIMGEIEIPDGEYCNTVSRHYAFMPECKHIGLAGLQPHCIVFKDRLQDNGEGFLIKCKACLEAERAE